MVLVWELVMVLELVLLLVLLMMMMMIRKLTTLRRHSYLFMSLEIESKAIIGIKRRRCEVNLS